jgi:rubrerythrin
MNALEFAINMELEGEKYYSEQAEINKDNSLRTVFLMLAKDEAMHAKVLQDKANKVSYNLNEEDEILTKAKSIFDDLAQMKDEIIAISNQLDAYRLALKNEEESINLYQKHLSQATDDDTKSLFEYLIKQEKDHYAVIDQLVLLINHSEEWVEAAEFGLREEY